MMWAVVNTDVTLIFMRTMSKTRRRVNDNGGIVRGMPKDERLVPGSYAKGDAFLPSQKPNSIPELQQTMSRRTRATGSLQLESIMRSKTAT